ncbi:hypothetical protein [Megamonas hypermegale]|uniref:hypothetical protein n=1 Tax=Megamonas hypermegale TaxID=158847 RepID=UPI0026F1AECD|nr:hypothetical protein [Megamonas hypermegale]
MKVYLVPTKQGYIQRKGIFKPNEIVPFLQSVIKRQAVILANIKKPAASKTTGTKNF